ncbi:MAG: PEP-CTERM sorting domain-containing protein, partial [Fimbriimonadaceae bacterium]
NADGWLYGDASGIRLATMADIESVLAGLTRIGINADFHTGADFSRVDDVTIVPVPEPTSLLVLGGASVFALRRRRART